MRIVLFAVIASASLPAAAQSMEPGEWQFNVTMTSPMLPKPQTTTFTRCMTKADTEDPTRFTAKEEAADCQVTPGARSAGSFSWTMSCPKQGMRGTGKARFGRDSIESEMQMSMDMQGQKMEMQNRTTGRLLGPCKTK